MIEVGCLAHARRKFNDLWVNHQSPLAEEALQLFGKLYDVEREAQELSNEQRQRMRQLQSRPIADKLREWLLLQRQKATDGTAMAKAIDYNLGRWPALIRFLDDGALPIDNNWVENRIRPIALGRSNWLFAGSLRAGKRAAVVMSLIQSARLNGHDPYRYLSDVLERLPTQPASRQVDQRRYRNRKPTARPGFLFYGCLTMTYFRMGNPHYHRRATVSRSCSGWEGVVPAGYGRQALTVGCARCEAERAAAFGRSKASSDWIEFGKHHNLSADHEQVSAHGYGVKPHGQLVPVSSRHYCPSTPGLSTWWSATTLQGDQVPGRSHLQACFPLRCFQRLSLPHLATRQCDWRHNRYTSGASTPVLSY